MYVKNKNKNKNKMNYQQFLKKMKKIRKKNRFKKSINRK